MSQSGSHTAQTSPSPESRPKPPTKDEPKNKKFSTDPVTPWQLEPKGVPIRTFAGYEFKLNGWVRQDVQQQRSLQIHQIPPSSQDNKSEIEIDSSSVH